MSDHSHHVVFDAGDAVSEILQTFRAPTGPWEMSRARRLARAAHAGVLSLPEVARATSGIDGARCALTAVTVDGSQSGGYVVEIRLAGDAPPDLARAIAHQVRQAADERGLGPYVADVSIVVEGARP